MARFLQVVLALLPLLLTPAIIYGLAEGVVDFGGGEKDIMLALPWLIWSFVFAMCSLVLIYRRWDIRRWTLRSALISTTVLFGLGVIAYAGGFLGIAWGASSREPGHIESVVFRDDRAAAPHVFADVESSQQAFQPTARGAAPAAAEVPR